MIDPFEPGQFDSTICDLLANAEWSRIWELLPSLPLIRSVQLLSLLGISGWLPENVRERCALEKAVACMKAVRGAYGFRRALLVPHTTLIHDGPIRCIRASPDGRYIFAGSAASERLQTPGFVTVWEHSNGDCLVKAAVDRAYVDELSIDPEGRFLAVSGYDRQITLIRLPECIIIGHAPGRFHKHRFVRGGQLIAAFTDHYHDHTGVRRLGKHRSGMVNNLRLFQIPSWEYRDMQCSPVCGEAFDLAESPDCAYLATALGLGDAIVIRDCASGNVICTLQGHRDSVRCVRFSPNGEFLASASYDGTIRVWDTRSWAELGCVANPEKRYRNGNVAALPHYAIEFSPDGGLLVGLSVHSVVRRGRRVEAGRLALLRVPDLTPVRYMNSLQRKADHFTFSRSGVALANGVIEGYGSVQIWETETGAALQAFDRSYICSATPGGDQLFLTTDTPSDMVHVVRLELLDFLLLPLYRVPEPASVSVREIAASGGTKEFERALVAMADSIRAMRYLFDLHAGGSVGRS